jgi:hypothetical protein
MAVAIDGGIFQDAYLAPLNPDSEIYLIPKSAAAEPGDHLRGRVRQDHRTASRKRIAEGGPAVI